MVVSMRASPFESFELTLSDVYLLTTDGGEEVAVPGLGVVIDQQGLTVTKPDGSVGAVVEWSDLKSLRAAERMEVEPGSPPAVVVEAVSNVRAHRFAVPTDDPEGLERVIGELAGFRPAAAKKDPAKDEVEGRRRKWGRRNKES